MRSTRKFDLSIPGWLWLFTLGHFSHHLLTALPVPLMPFIRNSFSLDYAQSGLLLSVFSIAYGISQLPAGWITQRMGIRMLIFIGIFGTGLAGVLAGLSSDFILLMICLGIMGFLGGGYHPAAPLAVSSTLPAAYRGKALGIHAIGGSAAYFIAPFIISASAAAWGWNSSFFILAVPTLSFGVILYILMGKKKSEQRNSNTAIECEIVPRKTGDRREFLFFIALSCITSIIFTAVISFIPLFLVDNFGMSQASAATSIAIVYLTGIFANPISGFLTDRLGRIPLMVSASLILIMTLFFMSAISGGWMIYFILIVLGISIALTQTSSESYIVGNIAENKCSSVLGIYYFVNLTGTGIMTPVLGTIIDNRGIGTGMFATAVLLSLAAIVFLWFLARNRRSKTSSFNTSSDMH